MIAAGRSAWLALLGLGLLVACSPSRPAFSGALEPRFVAVHNALSAIGLAQSGPIQEGTILEGREVRVGLSLPAGCVAIVAMGAEGVVDLNATLLDSGGAPLAHDTTTEPQAVLRPCLENAGNYVLVVKAAAGQGRWIVATWTGGVGRGGADSGESNASDDETEANGTCDAPIPLASGTVSGSTKHGEHENTGTCEGPSDSRELVYELDVTRRERVTLEVEATFDSVLYIRKDDCNDVSAEVDCNDDASDRLHSRLDRVLDPGKYFVFVDGYAHESGAFKLTVTTTELLALADVCRNAPLLATGVVQSASTAGGGDDAHATCGAGAEGADAPWRAELTTRSRVRVVEHSDEVAPVVHVRRACLDPASEMACGDSGTAPGDAVVTGVFEPGTYTVFADAHDRDAGGHYTLLWEVNPAAGEGTIGDACGDAVPLTPASGGTARGDTFAARDDVAGTCGGSGAGDVVYRVEVPRRSRLVASLDAEDAPHLLVAWRRCADASAEVACGRSISEVVSPGTYFIGVDGASAEAFGRFVLHWGLHDVSTQGGACADAAALVSGRSVQSTTAGGADRFGTVCGSGLAGATGPDRVYSFSLARRATVRIALTATGFDAVLALRKACVDVGAGPPPELACESDSDASHKTTLERTLEPGTYWVVVDGQSPNDQGPFTLDYRIVR